MASVPVFCRDLWAGRKKAPEGRCSPGKKGLIILLFVVSDVLDLNCDCGIAALLVGSDNDSCLCPLGVELHAIVAGFDLAKLLSDQIDKACHETSSLIVCRQGNSHILLCRIDALDVKINSESTKCTGICLDSCIQQFCSFFIELAVILDLAVIITQSRSLSLSTELLLDRFFLLFVRESAAATGGEHHHSHHTCQQQSDDL